MHGIHFPDPEALYIAPEYSNNAANSYKVSLIYSLW